MAEAITVARKTRSIVIQNVVLALGIKGVIMRWGSWVWHQNGVGGFADVGVALLAVLNALRAMK